MSAPNATLYVHNLNDGVRREELRAQLYYLFSTYGKVIDVVAQKGPKKRGQAFVVFRDLAGATSAMRSLDGELFYEKKMQIEYAKSQSHATLRLQDPNFVAPKLNQSTAPRNTSGVASSSKVTMSHAENDERKRARDAEDDDDEGPGGKKRRSDEAMDMDEDAEPVKPSAVLYCENLPAEVTEDVLAVLFQQYSGFKSTKLSAPNPTNQSKTAHVQYDSAESASVALEALNGFQIKRGWKIGVAYAAA
ncbi:RNA-binding domain-containing protein [Clavulina sp. PMI_390]|nr:RNA-binding domain-containing protein [Clavulina sp. PMI_390]